MLGPRIFVGQTGVSVTGTYAWSGDAVHVPLTVLRMGPMD